ncbi:MAG TPA: DUF2911 domain-containing protein [Bacteroidia bacterium]|nr:DUF2911 domain-containing protein [Bacteroidia bacterium]
MIKTKKIISAIAIAALGFGSLNAQAQQLKVPAPSPLQTLKQNFALGDVTIEYSRPGVKSRVIFGDVVPFGKIWRTGANATTKITFSDDVKLEGNDVKAGTYGLYTIPNKDSWDIMLYKDLTLGGDVAEYKQENEVLRFKVKPTTLTSKVESFTMNLADITATSANIELLWENTGVAIKLTTDIDAKVMKNIETTLGKDNRPYFQAASYYFDNNKDLKQASAWVDKALEQNPKAYYMMLLKAKIAYKQGDKVNGKASAEKTITMATEGKNDDYVAMAKKLLADNK